MKNVPKISLIVIAALVLVGCPSPIGSAAAAADNAVTALEALNTALKTKDPATIRAAAADLDDAARILRSFAGGADAAAAISLLAGAGNDLADAYGNSDNPVAALRKALSAIKKAAAALDAL